jgi:cystathionine beta-lyase/cystathionine gamma-synthase
MEGPRRFATRAVHGGVVAPPAERPVAPPLYQTSAFAFDDADHYAETLHAPGRGMVYTRYENPTTAALEALMADLEGGALGLATASGMAAIATTLLALATAGSRVVAQRAVYGGTYSLLRTFLPRCGVEVAMVDVADEAEVRAALRGGAAVLYAETIANPTMAVADLPLLGALAREAGAALVVDNTVASPVLCRPLEHGAAVVLHSATKYLGGHHDVVGGIAVFADEAQRLAAWHHLIDLGGSADPFAAWLVLRGVKTLEVRMQRSQSTAARLAEVLGAHPAVERVYWPGLPDHATHAVAERVLDGPGGFLSFDVAGGRPAGRRVVEGTRVARLAPSLGGIETLVSHPASTTHRQYDAEALAAAGIGEGMIRMSVGLEDPDDLAEDLRQALARV